MRLQVWGGARSDLCEPYVTPFWWLVLSCRALSGPDNTPVPECDMGWSLATLLPAFKI